ncbi:sulfite exporter TauE/SafE family protein [Citricoccus sp.]|uniref:sulfite exporter TauE/SafE family protein n=1 Tax=Citricoccus sp. TaxID=1978372 RepID=UPI00261800C5|nr:sulfite exporter TauE/SafE family protein [Citricoccus sp.]HRO29602.1 sulfite exporter TauE/SafE family protein [Citricoccus sp.]
MESGIALAVAAVLLGCVLQRTSGMGVGLVVSPALVLLIGPAQGVLLTNATAVVSAALMTVAVRSDVDWRRYARIAPVVVLGALPAAVLVRAAGPGWLELIIGAVLLVSVGGTTLLPRLPEVPERPAGLAAGILGGFLNTAVGVASPAFLAYARVTSWGHRGFAATLQPIFLTLGLVSIIVKVLLGSAPDADLSSWPLMLAVMAAVPVGVLLGGVLSRRFSTTGARRLAVGVVVLGAAGTLARGAVQLLGA